MAQARSTDIDLRSYIAVVRRRKLVVAVVAIIVTAVAIATSVTQEKMYRTTAEVLLQSRVSERIFAPNVANAGNNAFAIQTEVKVMLSQPVREAVAERLGWEPSVNAEPQASTSVVSVTVEHEDPALAALGANTYVETYIDVRRQQLLDDLLVASTEVQASLDEIDRQIAATDAVESSASVSLQSQRVAYATQLGQLQLATNLTQTGGAQVVSEAAVPGAPFKPVPKRTALLGIAVGLLLGIGIAFILEHLDDTLKDQEDLERTTGGTMLGLIPIVAGWRNRTTTRLISALDRSAPASEAYRSLRTSIQFVGIERPMALLQITSPSAAEGKTTTIANLATVLAHANHNVVVVCNDLRRPRVHQFFGLDNSVGFTSVLVGQATLQEALQPVPNIPNLRVLASGPPPPNPSELLSSPRAATVYQQLREVADYVLIDSPPLLPVTDGIVISGLVDATILVTSAGVTTRKNAQRAMELLRQVGAPIIGTVLNGAVSDTGYSYRYGYRPKPAARSVPAAAGDGRGAEVATSRSR